MDSIITYISFKMKVIMGRKFVISSASASGKTTLVNAILNSRKNMYRLKTCTTRPIRDEEKGDEYYFLSKQQAEEKILKNEFIEHSIVYGNIYGLTREEVDSHDSYNTIVILDVQGAQKFKDVYPDAITVFIEPPPLDILETRLKERNTSNIDVQKRLEETKAEMGYMESYDYIVKYDALQQMKRKFFRLIDFYSK